MEKLYFKSEITASSLVAFLGSGLDLPFELSDAPAGRSALSGVSDARNGGEHCLVFADRAASLNYSSLSGCFIVTDSLPSASSGNLVCAVEDPRAVFIELLTWLLTANEVSPHQPGFISRSVISPSARIASSAVIEDGVRIAEDVVIGHGAIVKSGCDIRKAVTIRENTALGVTGINLYLSKANQTMRFPHLAGVVIDEGAEIGANSVICRGVLSSTRIGTQTILGNLTNIGHGAEIGNRVWMSVGALIGGHSKILDHATIGMGATIRDNIVIGKNASIGMGSVVVKSVADGTSAFGNPAKKMAGLKTGPAR